MGFFDRIGKLWDAGFEVGRTAVNTVVDLAEAPFTEDEYDGFLDTIWGVSKDRGVELMQHTIGPEGVGGVLIGALPKPIREGGNVALEGLETAYREAIAEPISTVVTMASLGQAEGSGGFFGDDWGVWTDSEKWKLAYKIAQDRSPGQAVALAFATDDILDDEQVMKAESEQWFTYVSGTWDAATRIFLSPEIVAGGGVMAGRAISKRNSFNNYFKEGRGFSKFSDDVEELAVTTGARNTRNNQLLLDEKDLDDFAGKIKEKYFFDHHEGDVISTEIARAVIGGAETGFQGGKESLENVMRFFMGDASAIKNIEKLEGAATAHRYQQLYKNSNQIKQSVPPASVGGQMTIFDEAQDGTLTLAQGLISEMDDAPHVIRAFASIEEAIKPTMRKNFVHNDRVQQFYRSNWTMAPVRVVRDMRPQHFVWAGDANSGEQVARFMREAGFEADEIRRFRGQWARSDIATRAEVLARTANTKAIRKVAEKHVKRPKNMSKKDYDKEITKFIEDFEYSHESFAKVMSDVRKYDADKNISTIHFKDPDTGIEEMLQVPLNPSQLKQSVALVDIKKVDKAMRRQASKMPDFIFKANDIRAQSLHEIMKLWRPAVLLRPAWVMRVVGDEQLRMFAKVGTTERMWKLLSEDRPKYVQKVLENALVKTGAVTIKGGKVQIAGSKKLTARRAAVTGGIGLLVAGPVGAAIGASGSLARNTRALKRLRKTLRIREEARVLYEGGQVARAKELLQEIGEGPLTISRSTDIHDYEIAGAFGDALEPNILAMKANSANRTSRFLLGNTEKEVWNEVDEIMGDWMTYEVSGIGTSKAAEKRFGDWWERVVNDQWANNPVGQIAFNHRLGDASVRKQALIDWMHTDAGKEFAKKIPNRIKKDKSGNLLTDDIEDWAEQVVQATDRMVTNKEVAQLLADSQGSVRVTLKDLKRIAEKNGEDWKQYVGDIHGQQGIQLADDTLRAKKDRLVNRLFDRLGTVTTDNLSRNPYFKAVYEEDILRRVKAYKTTNGDYALTEDALKTIEASSRRKALNETRDLLYDLAERSEFADMMNNIMPFFNAYQEVLTRWAGLAIDNPVFVSRMLQTLRARPDTDWFQMEEVDGERYFTLRLPEFASELVSSGMLGNAFKEQSTIRFRADSINMVTQIAPGVGPIAQIPVSALVVTEPKFEEAFKFILPYGPVRGSNILEQSFDALQPAWVKRITSALSENRSYESTAATIMLTRMAEMADGDRDKIDFGDGSERAKFIAGVKEDAKNFHYLKAIASAFSPASVGFHSPYQPYIDEYRRLKKENIKTADKKFMDYLIAEGVEGFFALAARFSKNNEGLPATIESEETRTKYIDMIHKYPEIGGLILGTEGGGSAKWSAAVYEKQLREDTSPGSGVKRRERMSLDEILTDSRVREGWEEYGRINDIIFNTMRERGLPNLRVKEASDLLSIKQQAVLKLGERYPLWYKEYSNPDLTKWTTRIKGMRAVVADERLAGRDDIQLLAKYLEIRDAFTGELSKRGAAGGSSTMDSRSNQDLKVAWDSIIDQMIENPTFGDLLWRWLEFDPLTSNTWPGSQLDNMRKAA
ncbi:MAG: hypothetical protein CMG34_07795 [Candidatus Marinimicrobia bacterium]|nr:hypothetical protein [Candidatus Neomarinimicrobiota bacterium]